MEKLEELAPKKGKNKFQDFKIVEGNVFVMFLHDQTTHDVANKTTTSQKKKDILKVAKLFEIDLESIAHLIPEVTLETLRAE